MMESKKIEIKIDIHTKGKDEIIERLFLPAIYALLNEFESVGQNDTFELYLVRK